MDVVRFCQELAIFIRDHQALERVHIGRGIDSSGVKILCEGLATNSSLTQMDLSNNKANSPVPPLVILTPAWHLRSMTKVDAA